MRRPSRIRPLALIAMIAMGTGCDPEPADPPLQPFSLAIVSGTGQPGEAGSALPSPLVVEVREGGRPVAGVSIDWWTDFGVVTPQSSITDEVGQARAAWRLADRVGDQTAHAQIADQPPVAFTATAEVPAGAAVEISNPGADSATVGGLFPEPIEATVLIEPGRPLVGAPVAWDGGPGSGWLFPQATATDEDGMVAATWIAGSAPAQQVTARLGAASSTITVPAKSIRTRANAVYLDSSAPTGATGFRAEFIPLYDSLRTFYAVLVWDGAYAGLQRSGDLFDRQVHFSVWDAGGVDALVVDSASSVCHPFGGEGTGQKCRLDYPWENGGTYQFEMLAEIGDSHADYTVTFRDVGNGVNVPVATLRFGARPNLGWVTAFVEDFGPLAASCLATAPRGGVMTRREVRVNEAWQRVVMARFQAVDNLFQCANVLARVQDGGIFFGTGGELVGDPGAVGAAIQFPD